jgi:hypothetical protein
LWFDSSLWGFTDFLVVRQRQETDRLSFLVVEDLALMDLLRISMEYLEMLGLKGVYLSRMVLMNSSLLFSWSSVYLTKRSKTLELSSRLSFLFSQIFSVFLLRVGLSLLFMSLVLR